MDYNKFLPKLSQNLLEILEDNEYYDITIEVGNDPYVKIFRAHMVILNYRSSYLRRILSTNKKKNDGTLIHIKLPNILPEIFQIILRYIYGGRISLEEYDTSDIFKILVASCKLNLQELITYLQSFLIEEKANWAEQNFDLIYQTSFENDSLLELQKYCTNLITEDPDKIFNSPNFSSISEKILISLIQNNNLQMNEIHVWEHVIKWGLAQNPELNSELNSDPSSYSNDEFNSLKNTLQRCIPLIKFYHLTSREFLNKVYPYKKIIPEELFENLIKYFLDRDDKPQLSSSKGVYSNKLEPQSTKDEKIAEITKELTHEKKRIKTLLENLESALGDTSSMDTVGAYIHDHKGYKPKEISSKGANFNKSNKDEKISEITEELTHEKKRIKVLLENVESALGDTSSTDTVGPYIHSGPQKIVDSNKSEPGEIRLKSIDSKIITSQHVELILKWIDRLNIMDKIKDSYEFKLILRGSRDGFASSTFHEICDYQSRTVTIVKVKDSSEILGGYNPLIWKSDVSYGNTKDSFIFSFNDKEDIDNNTLSRVKDENYAIINSHVFGPSFSYDLILRGKSSYNNSYCKEKSYEKPIRNTRDKFSVEEYEVFQIIKDSV